MTSYRIYRNGALVATVAGTIQGWSEPRQRLAATYSVVAYDAAGNFSPNSGSWTAPRK